MKKPLSLATAATLAALLAACGGSDGGADPAPAPAPQPQPPATAEGVYKGTLSTRAQFYTLVLENGQFHTVYTETDSAVLEGTVHGHGTSTNGKFTSTHAADYVPGELPVSVSIAADYVPGASFNGTVTSGGVSMTFTGQAPAKAEYDYATPAKLADVAGAWTLTTIDGQVAQATVAADGTFSTVMDGCAFSGAFKPRASGKNVFDVALRFGPAPCVLANQTLTAQALVFNDRGPRLLATAVDEAKKISLTVLGTR